MVTVFKCQTCGTEKTITASGWDTHRTANWTCARCGCSTSHTNVSFSASAPPAAGGGSGSAPSSRTAAALDDPVAELARLKELLTPEDWAANGPLRRAYQQQELVLLSSAMLSQMSKMAPA